MCPRDVITIGAVGNSLYNLADQYAMPPHYPLPGPLFATWYLKPSSSLQEAPYRYTACLWASCTSVYSFCTKCKSGTNVDYTSPISFLATCLLGLVGESAPTHRCLPHGTLAFRTLSRAFMIPQALWCKYTPRRALKSCCMQGF